MSPRPPALAGPLLRALAVGLLAALALPASAQAVRGFVSDAERGPLAGASVAVQRVDAADHLRGAVTDAQGFYEVGGLAPGRYVVRASYVGYAAVQDTLAVGEGPTTWSPVLVAGDALDEVVVQAGGGAADVSGGLQRIRPADLARIPSPDVAGDLAVYLQSLPGVVTVGDRGGGLFVRGGTPAQNLVLVDGAPVFQPFHVVGFFSAFPEDLVGAADFYAGGFGAKYSGRVSSVLDVTLREGSTESFKAAGTAGPFVVSAQAEGPLARGRSSWIASARTSVVEPLAALVGATVPLQFSDGLVKLATATDASRCSAMALTTYDRGRLAEDSPDAFEWRNVVLGGRCISAPPGLDGRVDVAASLSHLRSGIGEEADFLFSEGRERSSKLTEGRFSAELTRSLGAVRLRAGARASLVVTEFQLGDASSAREDGDFLLGGAAHVELDLPLGALTLTPGVAAVLRPYSTGAGLEPRLRASYLPSGRLGPEISAAAGLYRQSLVGLTDERDAASPFIAWTGPPPGFDEQRAVHVLGGATVPVTRNLRIGAEAYGRRIDGLPVPIWSARTQFTLLPTEARSTSYGADARLEWTAGPVYTYLSYAFGVTTYEAVDGAFLVRGGTSYTEYNPAHDRRHQVQLAVSADVGAVNVGARWQIGSGLPYTRPYGYDTVVPPFGLPEVVFQPGFPRVVFERPFNGRLPAYHRLDLSAGTAFDLGSRAALDVRAGAVNAYNRANVFYYDVFRGRRVDQLPIVPYVSARLRTR
ncbi:TonB-dependent receptor [Rubrivirga sp. IMCC45206]|uniref:TonB-dependent receptor n=1 Tax=Rubrivirga sp. IMCC45206 TaxID=3391614 RepID=UPI00398FB9DC